MASKIKKALKIQQGIEGHSPQIALLLKILPHVKTQQEWRTLTSIVHHRYGKLSYETHIFYYPSELLNKLMEINQ